ARGNSLARAATERRKARAPEADARGNADRPWRSPHPEHRQAVTFVGVVRLVMRMRLSALRPPYLFGGKRFRAVACRRLGRKKRVARTIFLTRLAVHCIRGDPRPGPRVSRRFLTRG